jgi:hypothetical protein
MRQEALSLPSSLDIKIYELVILRNIRDKPFLFGHLMDSKGQSLTSCAIVSLGK